MESNSRTSDFAPPVDLARLRTPYLVAGVVGLVVAGIGFAVDRPHFFQAWLVSWLLWLSVALGCLGLAMLQYLSGGAWGMMIRRPLEAGARTLPLLLVLFLPLIAGVGDLFEWSHADVVRASETLTAKSAYLNLPFFVARAAIYFACWIGLAWTISSLARKQDETGDPMIGRRLAGVSAGGFLLLALTSTFAAIDWMMSLDPHWQSSLYGLWFFAGLGLSGLCFCVVVANWLRQRAPLAGLITRQHFHDYGKLFFAFTMLWAYLSFSQFLLIWAGNLPEEIPFYLRRMHHGWGIASTLLVLGHFVLPFLILLSADVKRRGSTLVKVAVWMIAMRWLDYFWNVAPTLDALRREAGHPSNPWLSIWIDLAALVGLGGVFVWFYLGQLASRPLLPVQDPELAEVLANE